MHFLALYALPLAVGALSINPNASPPKVKPVSKKALPIYDWEHRTTCTQELLNPNQNNKDKYDFAKHHVLVVGYVWDESNGLTPDHKWNWNSTLNAMKKIRDNMPWAGQIVYDEAASQDLYSFEKGQPNGRGFTQFTAEFVVRLKYPGGGHEVDDALNRALGSSYSGYNPYLGIVCINRDGQEPWAAEKPYIQVENELHLDKLRYEQLHQDRLAENHNEMENSDTMIQSNADKVPHKTPEMEESDRKIQGLPFKQNNNSTS